MPPGAIAAADYWKYGLFGGVSQVSSTAITNGSSYDQGRIRYDHSQSVKYGYHGWKVAGHEIGHILGMNHFENSPADSGNHWMRSGSFTLSNPTSTGISHLRAKWRN